MRAAFLRRAIRQFYRNRDYRVNFEKSIHVGNGMIDGEAIREPYHMAIELKSDRDDVLRGLGQLLEAVAHSYNQAVLVTSQQRAKRLDTKVFDWSGLGLGSVDSRGDVTVLAEPKIIYHEELSAAFPLDC
jgi:hypothetical protein